MLNAENEQFLNDRENLPHMQNNGTAAGTFKHQNVNTDTDI